MSKKSKRVVLSDAEKRMVRDDKIRRLYDTGKYTQRSLAAKVGLSKSRINEILD
jgi:DNA-binding XRE family transcriptional regulator